MTKSRTGGQVISRGSGDISEGEVRYGIIKLRKSLLMQNRTDKKERLGSMFKIICMLLLAGGLAVNVCGMDIYNSKEAALKSGNYSEARRLLLRLIQSDGASVNTASSYIQLALVDRCLYKDNEAKTAISNAIYNMKNGDMLGNGCEARAEILLRKINKLPRRLSYREIYDISAFTMEIPYAQWHREMDRIIARYDALAGRFSSQTRSLLREREFQASVAKFYAKQEYEKSTKSTFNPNYPPPRGSEAREKWNACKRIYDIWGN